MKIKDCICKCGNDDLYIQAMGSSFTGLYCKNCRMLIKILSENEKYDILKQIAEVDIK